MNKELKLLIAVISLLFVAIIVSWLLYRPSALPPAPQKSPPTPNTLPTPTLSISKYTPPTYTPPPIVLGSDNSVYKIIYSETAKTYAITIYSKDFANTRTLAENALLAKLGVTKTQACSNIKVVIGSPYFVTKPSPPPLYTKFSFCN